ncbi:MAG: hypothetical protein ACKO96_24930, partial [Flammeovirgaceae bacterium]
LNKEILNLPLIVIEYPENKEMSVGLSLDKYGVKGDLNFRGGSFLICNPASQNDYFGKDERYKKWKYKIVVEYFP